MLLLLQPMLLLMLPLQLVLLPFMLLLLLQSSLIDVVVAAVVIADVSTATVACIVLIGKCL